MTTSTSTPTIQALTGDWVIDKSKSENIDGALKLQGIGWLRRKAVTSGTITLAIKQTTPDPNSTSIMTQQGLRGIFPGVEQTRALDWKEHEHVDAVSGAKIHIKSRFVKGERDEENERENEGVVKPVLRLESGIPEKEKVKVEGYLGQAVPITMPVFMSAEQVSGPGSELERAFVQDFITCPEGGWTAEQVWAVENSADGVRLLCRAVAVKGASVECACQVYQLAEQQQ